jgi:hypothetical protein
VVHQGIFEDPFVEEWVEAELESKVCTAIIDHIIQLCDFPANLIIVKYIGQQQWSTLAHVMALCFRT